MLRIFRIKAIELHLVHKKQNFSSEVISGGGALIDFALFVLLMKIGLQQNFSHKILSTSTVLDLAKNAYFGILRTVLKKWQKTPISTIPTRRNLWRW